MPLFKKVIYKIYSTLPTVFTLFLFLVTLYLSAVWVLTGCSYTATGQAVKSEPVQCPLSADTLLAMDADSFLQFFREQISKNRRPYIDERRYHLLRTIPFDTLAVHYIEKGFKGAIPDTVHILDYWDYDRTTIPRDQEYDKLDELYRVARRYKSNSLELSADFIKGYLMHNIPGSYEAQMEWFERVLKKAQKQGDKNMAAHVLTEMWKSSYFTVHYSQSFEYAARLEKALDESDDDYAYKGLQYIWLGLAYHKFMDYDRATHFLHKGLGYRDPSHELFSGNYLRAWNHLAEYHMLDGNPDSAAYYYKTIIASPESVVYFPFHSTNAIGNLGRIELKKGNTDTAIAMMQAALEHMVPDHREWIVATGFHNSLGYAYLTKGDMTQAKYHIVQARNHINDPKGYFDKFAPEDKENIEKDWYALVSKYHATLGDTGLFSLYLDSALIASSRYERLSGQHIILRGEQRLKDAEIEIQNKNISRQRSIISLAAILVAVLISTLGVIIFLYRRRQAAYRVLAEKACAWADSGAALTGPDHHNTAETVPALYNCSIQEAYEEEYKEFTDRLQAYMTEQKPYTDPELTLEGLAALMEVNRNRLSEIINRKMDKNFKQYINELRVMEALHLMNANPPGHLSMEQLMEGAGFNGRTTFYTFFKTITGLTPAQYWKSIKYDTES